MIKNILLVIIISSSCKPNYKQSKKEILYINDIKSVHIKDNLYSKDSLVVSQFQVEYLLNEWENSLPSGFIKFTPKRWINITFQNGNNLYLKTDDYFIKSINNDFTYKFRDSSFINKLKYIPRIKNNKIEYILANKGRNVYTGIITYNNEIDDRTSIYINRKSKTEISYNFSRLLNWKEKTKIKGVAEIDKITKINNKKNQLINSFLFIDKKEKIEIYLTPNLRNCIVKQNGEIISAFMYKK
jgi:hypothetical protein